MVDSLSCVQVDSAFRGDQRLIGLVTENREHEGLSSLTREIDRGNK